MSFQVKPFEKKVFEEMFFPLKYHQNPQTLMRRSIEKRERKNIKKRKNKKEKKRKKKKSSKSLIK
jgi:hypothetical protein